MAPASDMVNLRAPVRHTTACSLHGESAGDFIITAQRVVRS